MIKKIYKHTYIGMERVIFVDQFKNIMKNKSLFAINNFPQLITTLPPPPLPDDQKRCNPRTPPRSHFEVQEKEEY